MKKLILVLAIALMASPTFAAMTIYLHRVGTTTTVDVNYTDANALNLPRAFGLDVTIGSPGKIANVTNYVAGESNSTHRGFGIYPARIAIDSAGVVSSFGTPLADTADPGAAGTGTGTSHVILEFASLYVGDANKPATSGRLCSLIIDPTTATSAMNIRMFAETTYRGGVVLEDGTLFPVDVNTIYVTASLPGKATNPSPTNGGTAAYNATLSWTAGSGATGRDVYFGTVATPVTQVVTNGTATTYVPGSMFPGKTYYWRVNEKNAVGTTTGDIWNFTVSSPTCWGYMAFTCGDATGDNKITALDLAKVKASWNATTPATKYNPCGDFTKDGKITALDLAKIKTNWNKTMSHCP